MVHTLIVGITKLDRELYSDKTRKLIQMRLQNADSVIAAYLNDPVETRNHLYRFYLKGSNSFGIVLYFLEEKYSIRPSIFPTAFESDWDTSILINPFLPVQIFNIIFDTLIPIIQRCMTEISNQLAYATPGFHANIRRALRIATDIMNLDPEFEPYRKYSLTYKHDKQSFLRVHDGSSHLFEIKNYIQMLGLSGTGTYVTSNRNGGAGRGNNAAVRPKFYLARIMAPVVVSRDMWLPVELLDVSMNYQNDDLKFAWETYSEYHVQHAAYDFRVSSPTALYFDISKCIRNASNSNNQTKKNKVPARTKRLQELLDTMIVPYKNTNAVIRTNLERHADSNSVLVRTIRRGMTRKYT